MSPKFDGTKLEKGRRRRGGIEVTGGGETTVAGAPASQRGQSSLRRLSNAAAASTSKKPTSYPPISSIPRTPRERLNQAPVDDPSADAGTVLYLAYGSNLCAETFLGRRGIRPLSQVNVSAPAFDLVFDLPGIPYSEPCFANTRPRVIPKPPIPFPGKPPKFPPPTTTKTSITSDDSSSDDSSTESDEDEVDEMTSSLSSSSSSPDTQTQTQPPKWNKGLYGVVYEVTAEDYAHIIKTEGGGQGYHDVLTPCFELPPALHIPERPPIPDLPSLPFLAHTLYAPPLPIPEEEEDETEEDTESEKHSHHQKKRKTKKSPRSKLTSWLRSLLLPMNRRGVPAEASPRYLKLIRDGAREHGLPDEYQAWLAAHAAYQATTFGQKVGKWVFLITVLPWLMPLFILGRLMSDPATGRTPRAVGVATTVAMNLIWAVYDVMFRPVFGDGEHTVPVPPKKKKKATEKVEGKSCFSSSELVSRDERNRLLQDW